MLIKTTITGLVIIVLAIAALLLYGAQTPGGLDRFMDNTECLLLPEQRPMRFHLGLSWFAVVLIWSIASGWLISVLARREIHLRTGAKVQSIWSTFYPPPRRSTTPEVHQMYVAARFMIYVSIFVGFVFIFVFVAPIWNSAFCTEAGY